MRQEAFIGLSTGWGISSEGRGVRLTELEGGGDSLRCSTLAKV